jgi:drug/metabolite transporter (DMT)-like permease
MKSASAVPPIASVRAPLPAAPARPALWLVLTAFAAVYLIWGSTYLGIRLAIDSMPPLLMAGARFLIAGLILYCLMRFRGEARPAAIHWRNATIIGAALLLAGNGGVSWAQQTVPSSIAALMVAATPLWINLMDWLRPHGKRPPSGVFVGILLGFIGVTLIALGKSPGGQNVIDPLGAAMLLAAPFCWAGGSIFSRHALQPSNPLLTIGMQMMAGGILLLIAGAITGELPHFQLSRITATSAWAFVYLTLIGSLVGFTAYVWLLQVSTPARVSTYAYVNPFIAVLLGHLVLHERLPSLVLFAGALIIAAVVVITSAGSRK